MTDILAFCTASGGELSHASLEVLAAGRRLGDELGNDALQAVLLGPDIEGCGEMVVHRGADEVFVVSHSRLQYHEADVILQALEKIVQQLAPDVILFPHDELSGGNVAPRLAYRLGTGIVTDCTGFEVEGETIRWLRPVYGGKAMAYMVASGPVQLATMRSLAFEPLPADATRRGRVQALEMDVASIPSRVQLVDRIVEEEEFEGLSLDHADIIVSGGRGMEAKEAFVTLRELADVLGAAVGGSRPAADLGWVPHSHLVGQTGKIVAPSLYIAVAISGAPQHMAGAGSAKTIVAINKDEDAPIFKVAHVGVVDEWQNIIPDLTESCKELLSRLCQMACSVPG
jgi:electron transfer flavoprotein alpha subunit